MTIEIIKEPTIKLAQADHERLLTEYNASMAYSTHQVSFEVWLRGRQQQKERAFQAWHYPSADQP